MQRVALSPPSEVPCQRTNQLTRRTRGTHPARGPRSPGLARLLWRRDGVILLEPSHGGAARTLLELLLFAVLPTDGRPCVRAKKINVLLRRAKLR